MNKPYTLITDGFLNGYFSSTSAAKAAAELFKTNKLKSSGKKAHIKIYYEPKDQHQQLVHEEQP